ncbi:DUF3618 domain-containing protein [Micromonospora humi]|uniref:DUF3618 domain-containing protein n=1 Tax=Micromonospora humi TaxID=745366 RepID=A0A1C5JPN2_9ACTN|nr:DUF3618 domain-containing protein [Micromonospora humi]SCG72477.1 Protein of unknown function [Micromonospora humi]
MSESTPSDPQQLRAEIAQTRAALGDTVEALAAKTDVKARAKVAAEEAGAQAKATVNAAVGRAGQVAGAVTERLASTSESIETSVREHDLPERVRRPLPVAAIGAVAVLAVVLVVLARRRRA